MRSSRAVSTAFHVVPLRNRNLNVRLKISISIVNLLQLHTHHSHPFMIPPIGGD